MPRLPHGAVVRFDAVEVAADILAGPQPARGAAAPALSS